MHKTTITTLCVLAALLCGGELLAQEAPPVDMTGRWLMVQHTVTSSEVAVLGKISATTRALILYDLAQDGAEVSGRGQLCALDIDSGTRLVRTLLPRAFREAQPEPSLKAAWRLRGGQWRLEQPRTWTVLGARLDEPLKDPLPLQADAPEVWDQDRDGKPGLTVRVEGIVSGDIYVVQRSWSDLIGLPQDQDLIRGRVRFDQEQIIVGATHDLLTDPPEATPDLRQSFFALARLPQSATCAEASQKAKNIK